MYVTLDMLFTRLIFHCKQITIHTDLPQKIIHGIKLLPYKNKILDENILYITDITNEDALNSFTEHATIVCFDIAKKSFNTDNIIFIETEMELAEVFDQLNQCLQEFVDWQHNLDFAIFRNASFQEFIDISENLLDSPLLIYDPALKLLAYSTNHTPNDPIFQSAIAEGYLNKEIVNNFEKENIFKNLNEQGIVPGFANDFRKHNDLSRAICVNDELVVYCILLYASEFPTDYISQLFEILCEKLQKLLEKQHKDFIRNRSMTDYFLMDLLDNPDTPLQQIKERISYNHLKYEDDYILLSIHSDIHKNASEKYFIQYLRTNLLNCQIFSYNQRIILLYILNSKVKKNYKEYLKKELNRLLSNYLSMNLHVYISRPFDNIGLFSKAYLQTENMALSQSNNKTNIFIFFEKHWIYDLIYHNTSKDKIFNYCEPVILELFKSQTKKSGQLLQILYEYLNNDRKMTIVAEKLDMHRNNVIYHIQQFENLYDIDLNDADTRLKLLLSFKILEMYSINNNY